MLIVLARLPVTTPRKAGLGEETVAEVASVYLIGKRLGAVAVLRGGGRLYKAFTIGPHLIIGIVEGVDIDSQPAGMFRQLGGTGNGAIAEARRVVVTHLPFIVSIIDIGQHHTLNRILRIIELTQDAYHAVGNAFVAHHLAHMYLLVVVPVQHADMAQVVALDIRVLLIGLALHPLPHPVGDGLGGEALIHSAEGLYSLGTHRLTGLPLCEYRHIGCGGTNEEGSEYPQKQLLHTFLRSDTWITIQPAKVV